jgi:CBS domain-containing protein
MTRPAVVITEDSKLTEAVDLMLEQKGQAPAGGQ